LSEAGQRLLPHARQVLEQADRCATIVQAPEQRTPFELTVGTRYELGLSWLLPALPRLEALSPERTVHLYTSDATALMRALDHHEVDAVLSSTRLTGARLRYATLHPEEYVFCAAPGVRCTGPEDAPGLVLCDTSPALPLFRYLLDSLGQAAPWRFRRHQYLGGIGGIRAYLRTQGGVGVLPRYFIERDLEAGDLVPLLPQVALRADAFRLVWRRGDPRESRLLALADALRDIPLA